MRAVAPVGRAGGASSAGPAGAAATAWGAARPCGAGGCSPRATCSSSPSAWYSPSPGIVYPTLTYLEEVGYVTSQSEGAKRLYTITQEGRAHLAANRDRADALLDRLATVGERVARWRRMSGRDGDDRRAVPPLVEAALSNLREVALTQLDADAQAEARVVEILARAALEMKKEPSASPS